MILPEGMSKINLLFQTLPRVHLMNGALSIVPLLLIMFCVIFFSNTNGFDMFRNVLGRLAIDSHFINLGDRILAGYFDDGGFGGSALFCEERLWHMYLSDQGALLHISI